MTVCSLIPTTAAVWSVMHWRCFTTNYWATSCTEGAWHMGGGGGGGGALGGLIGVWSRFVWVGGKLGLFEDKTIDSQRRVQG